MTHAQTDAPLPRPEPIRITQEHLQLPVPIPPLSDPAAQVSTGREPSDTLINRLYRMGKAAGLAQVIYDNRDGDHSRLNLQALPQMRETRYGAPLMQAGLDRGLAGRFRFDAPVIGNASLAVTKGVFRRSLPRLIMQDQRAAQTAWELYAGNQLYVHPEHRDHDMTTGDLYPAQTPYVIISQGSSGSDRAFLRALALTYAAFSPETFERLRAEALLPATAQMILRRTRQGIRSDAQYLSPAAHPGVFARDSLRPAAMISLANALRADQIPPMVRLEVLQDLRAKPGWDFLSVNRSEQLFTTPGAIARVWRSFAGQRKMVISAGATKDPNGHPLTFEWVLLRGNPEKVDIAAIGPGDSQAEITVDWHSPPELTGPGGIAGSRVEIAVIAHNGFYHSAPAFVSIALPPHQNRQYAGTGAQSRLWRVDYRKTGPIDPLIWPVAPWDDRLAHGPEGQVTTMTRRRDGNLQPDTLRRLRDGSWQVLGATGENSVARMVHKVMGPPTAASRLEETPLD